MAGRVLSDNAWSYTHNRSLREPFRRLAITHETIQPYLGAGPVLRCPTCDDVALCVATHPHRHIVHLIRRVATGHSVG